MSTLVKASSAAAAMALPLVGLLVAWHIWGLWAPESRFYFGSPLGIWREAAELLTTGVLPRAFLITLGEATAGFLAGTILGTTAGLLLWLNATVQRTAHYYLAVLGAMPLFALGPMFVFWFGTGAVSKIVLSFIGTFVIATAQASAGTMEVSRGLLHLGRAYGLSEREILRQIVAPAAFVWVLAGLRLSGAMAILGAVVGEFIASRDGLGHLIIVAEGLYNVNQIWVGLLAIGAISLLLLAVTGPIDRKARAWRSTT